MRRFGLAVMVVGLLALLVPAPPASAEPETHTVYMSNIAFCNTPQCVPFQDENTTITVGDTVRWVFADGLCTAGVFVDGCHHTATHKVAYGSTETPEFNSGKMAPLGYGYGGQPKLGKLTYEHTFDTAGSYTYWCTWHKSLMQATIDVE